MRPGQNNNKRMRGNRPSNNRRGPNPLTRSYEFEWPGRENPRQRPSHRREIPAARARRPYRRRSRGGGELSPARRTLFSSDRRRPGGAGPGPERSPARRGRRRRVRGRRRFRRRRRPFRFTRRARSRSLRATAGARLRRPAAARRRRRRSAALFRRRRTAAPGRPQQQLSAGSGTPAGSPAASPAGSRAAARSQRSHFGDRQDRDGRGRDFRPREFRPYRDPNAPRDPQPAPAGDAATALPSFITAAPRVTTAPDSETPGPMENGVEAGGQVDQGSSPSEQSSDARFPGRGRRRRLRSPYGFHPSGNQDEEGEGPLTPDDAPVSE